MPIKKKSINTAAGYYAAFIIVTITMMSLESLFFIQKFDVSYVDRY